MEGGDEKYIIHPQVIVELFERLAVHELSTRVNIELSSTNLQNASKHS